MNFMHIDIKSQL